MPTLDIHQLVEWGEQNHAILNPDVGIYLDDLCGLSLKALQNIDPGTELVTCPKRISLSYLNAINEGWNSKVQFPQEFLDLDAEGEPHIIGHFFLVKQYLLGQDSFWFSYIRTLPQPNDSKKLAIPVWWPQSDQAFLEGTNAGPPIKKRQDIWVEEWSRGISLLGTDEAWKGYTYDLYQWAATIFGSRSFRASLVLDTPTESDRMYDNIVNDRFSVLLPILDIGNHNGVNNATWKVVRNCGPGGSEKGMCFSNIKAIQRGVQIFNYYGDKSNSELLVAYGFTLPSKEQDRVNLKLKVLSEEALALRRSQKCHIVPKLAEEEFMFSIPNPNPVTRSMFSGSPFEFLPHDLVDMILCMVANPREVQHLVNDFFNLLLQQQEPTRIRLP